MILGWGALFQRRSWYRSAVALTCCCIMVLLAWRAWVANSFEWRICWVSASHLQSRVTWKGFAFTLESRSFTTNIPLATLLLAMIIHNSAAHISSLRAASSERATLPCILFTCNYTARSVLVSSLTPDLPFPIRSLGSWFDFIEKYTTFTQVLTPCFSMIYAMSVLSRRTTIVLRRPENQMFSIFTRLCPSFERW